MASSPTRLAGSCYHVELGVLDLQHLAAEGFGDAAGPLLIKVIIEEKIYDQVVAAVTYNPRPIDFAGVRAMLDAAYHGRRP